jgi:hypothetical protein
METKPIITTMAENHSSCPAKFTKKDREVEVKTNGAELGWIMEALVEVRGKNNNCGWICKMLLF